MSTPFDCCYCNKNYTTAFVLQRHIREIHKIEDVGQFKITRSKIICPECRNEFPKHSILREHVQESHGVQICEEILEFPNMAAFSVWLTEEEEKTGSKYVLRQGTREIKTGRISKLSKVHRYICHRSGYYNSEGTGKRRIKRQSCKIDATCISAIEAVEGDSVKVKYWNTHFGHGYFQSTLPLSKSRKDMIAVAGELAQDSSQSTRHRNGKQTLKSSNLMSSHHQGVNIVNTYIKLSPSIWNVDAVQINNTPNSTDVTQPLPSQHLNEVEEGKLCENSAEQDSKGTLDKIISEAQMLIDALHSTNNISQSVLPAALQYIRAARKLIELGGGNIPADCVMPEAIRKTPVNKSSKKQKCAFPLKRKLRMKPILPKPSNAHVTNTGNASSNQVLEINTGELDHNYVKS